MTISFIYSFKTQKVKLFILFIQYFMTNIIGRNNFTSNLVFQMLFGTSDPLVGSRTLGKLLIRSLGSSEV